MGNPQMRDPSHLSAEDRHRSYRRTKPTRSDVLDNICKTHSFGAPPPLRCSMSLCPVFARHNFGSKTTACVRAGIEMF